MFFARLLQKEDARVRSERFGLEELLKSRASGLVPPGGIHSGPLALEQSTFLLDPGGRDYVGNNSYDAQAEWTSKEPS